MLGEHGTRVDHLMSKGKYDTKVLTKTGRSYDYFWTQWTVGTAEFSDIAMPRPPKEDLYHEFFLAKHTTKYLENYVDQQTYGGQTLRNRIELGVEVHSVQRVNGCWTISVVERAHDTSRTLHTSKLIVASGLTSIPHMPLLPEQEKFAGPILHQDSFGSSDILQSPNVQNITVLGGAKSAADMIYAAVRAGKTVSWVLKASETTGPGFLLLPKGKGPYKDAFELGMIRVAATFTPSFMNGETWWTRFLHGSKYGIKMIRSFWEAVNKEILQDANFDGRESLQGFNHLMPHTPSVCLPIHT